MYNPHESTTTHRRLKAAPRALSQAAAELACASRTSVFRAGRVDARQIVLFVHGTPGSALDWQLVCDELFGNGFDGSTLSLDRPGFGRNAAWHAAEEWETQIDFIEAMLLSEWEQDKQLLVVGHSYGAALAVGVAERLATTGRLSGLLLVSGVLSPLERQCRWYHRLILLPLVSSLFPKRYRQSAKEMVAVGRELAALDDVWGQLDFPVTLIHGDGDTLIPFSNSEFAAAKLDKQLTRLVRVPGGGHALPRSHADLIAREIEAVFSRVAIGEGGAS